MRAGEDSYIWTEFLTPHPLTNSEIQKYYQNEPKLNGVYSKNSLPKIIDGENVINLDEFKFIPTHWTTLYMNANNIIYFHSLGVKNISKWMKISIGNKNIITNIYRIQAYDSILCGYFCNGFINFVLKCSSLSDYTNLFSPNKYQNNDKIILKHFP